ncbi:unnamed protein product [Caenorhabditis nigoni]
MKKAEKAVEVKKVIKNRKKASETTKSLLVQQKPRLSRILQSQKTSNDASNEPLLHFTEWNTSSSEVNPLNINLSMFPLFPFTVL